MKNYLCVFLLFFFSAIAHGQQMTVNGLITSAEDGEPIIGASVTVKGNTTIGTVTDLDGKFQLNVPNGTKKIVVSYIGMKSQEVTPKSGLIKIVLESDAQELGEIVVTGMQKMDKRLFTGATTKLDASKTKLDGMADISRGLEGRAAGVSVQNVSGTFGTAPKIRVRGATSIYGSSKPLWVVDGIVMEDNIEIGADELSSGNAETLISSAIAGLNADDIESFQILKDGSATSIYGARAMAGVVVVTTKKGAAGTSRISYTGEFTTRMTPSYKNFNLMNSQEQMDVYKEMQQKGWLNLGETMRASESGVYGKMYQLINTYENGAFALDNTESARNIYLRKAEFRNTDWFDVLFNNNLSQNHAVSISGGTEKAKFYASMSLMHDPGWTKSSSVDRYTINANGSFSLSKNLTFNILGNGSYRKQEAPGTLGQDIDVVNGAIKRDFDINPYSYALNTSRTLDPKEFYTRNYAYFNILDELENNYIDLNLADVKFQGELNWKIIQGLEVSAVAAIRYSNAIQEHNIKDFSNQARAYRAGIDPEDATIRDSNPLLYKDPDVANSLPVTILPNGGIYNRTENSMKSIDFRATASWNTHINEVHLFNLFAGMETNATDRQRTWFRGWGYQYSMGGNPYYDYLAFKQGKEENTQYYTNDWTYSRSVATFASGTYSYNGKYVLNGTIRYEGTNKLGRSRAARWLPTWNISAAWNMHEENWFKKIEPALSHLTLKASYSLTADRGPASVSNSQVILMASTPWRPSADVTEAGLYIDGLENSELTYEKKREFNFGFDAGFLDNRINFSFDVFTRSNYDLIGLVNTMGVGGETRKFANVASMKSHGYEFTLSTLNIKTKNFSWNTDFIFSDSRTKITDLRTSTRVIDLITGQSTSSFLEGYPVRALFSIPFMGLNENGYPTFINQDNELTVHDINFQEYQNLDFLKYEGPIDPPITGSFGNTFKYKGFGLNLFITYSFGNKVRLDPVFDASYSDLTAMPKEFKNRWMVPGDENITDVPAILSRRETQQNSDLRYAYNAYNYSTVRVANGGFIRMKEISFSYDFPKNVTNALRVNNLQLKLQATNLFLLYSDSKLNGQDPEFFNTGGVASPLPKQFTLTVRFSL